MKRRRKWKAPNNPTTAAKQVWSFLFPQEPWPRGWQVKWAGFMRGALGLTIWQDKVIVLSYGDAKKHGCVETLAHEFVHVRAGHGLRHGADFRRFESALLSRLGLAPTPNVLGHS